MISEVVGASVHRQVRCQLFGKNCPPAVRRSQILKRVNSSSSIWQSSMETHCRYFNAQLARPESRMPEIRSVSHTPSVADGNRHRARVLRDELQAPRRRHRKLGQLADDAGHPAMPQALLETAEYALLVAHFGIDAPIGVEPRLCHAGAKRSRLVTHHRILPGAV